MQKIDLLGLKVSSGTKQELLSELKSRLDNNQKTFITTPYSEFFYLAARNYEFKDNINNSDFALADGISVLWLAYYLNLTFTVKNYYLKIIEAFWQGFYSGMQIIFAPKKIQSVIPERISGSDFFWDLIKFAGQNNLAVFFLGGFDDTPKKVAEAVQKKYPHLKLVGYSNAYPTDFEQNQKILQQINSSAATILFVAYGPVKQERWIANNLNNLNVKVAIGVGGTFDYISGAKKTPPKLMKKLGLEWLYRLVTQPKRFKRIWHALVSFTIGALRHKVFMSLPYRKNVVGVIINEENKVFVGKRKLQRDPATGLEGDDNHWQLPQGGIDKNESFEQAFEREMFEELGVKNLQILGKSNKGYSYLWPHFRRKLLINNYPYRGQSQQIIFAKYNSKDPNNQIKLDQHEFTDYKWASPEDLKNIIHRIRQEMLAVVLEDLYKYL